MCQIRSRREGALLSMPLTSSWDGLVQPHFPVGDGVTVAFVPTLLSTVLTAHAMGVRSAQVSAHVLYVHGAIVYVDRCSNHCHDDGPLDGWMVHS